MYQCPFDDVLTLYILLALQLLKIERGTEHLSFKTTLKCLDKLSCIMFSLDSFSILTRTFGTLRQYSPQAIFSTVPSQVSKLPSTQVVTRFVTIIITFLSTAKYLRMLAKWFKMLLFSAWSFELKNSVESESMKITFASRPSSKSRFTSKRAVISWNLFSICFTIILDNKLKQSCWGVLSSSLVLRRFALKSPLVSMK